MIVANDVNGNKINLYEFKNSMEKLKVREKGPFFCPICKQPVLFKCGIHKIPHFAHVSLNECINERKESKEHYDGKYDFYQLFKEANINVNLEVYIQAIQQRTDLLVEFGKDRICIEYQCSIIPLHQLIQRTEAYKQECYKVLWIFGLNMLKQKSKYIFALNELCVYCLGNATPQVLIYYHPQTKTFSKLSTLIAFSPNVFVGQKTNLKINKKNLSNVLSHQIISKNDFVSSWCKLKKTYRKSQHLNFKGSFYLLKEILYSLRIDYLPAEIGIPLSSNYYLNEHCIVWQGILYFTFIHDMEIDEMIDSKELTSFLCQQIECKIWKVHSVKNIENSNLGNCVENYIEFLEKNRIVKRLKNGKIMKTAHVVIPTSLQQALDEDFRVTNIAYELLFK